MIINNNKARTTTTKQQRHQTKRNIKATTTSNQQKHGRHINNNKIKFVIQNKDNGNMKDNDETTMTTPITTIIKKQINKNNINCKATINLNISKKIMIATTSN